MSYIFGELDDLETVVDTVEMQFKSGAEKVPVQFVSVHLQMYADDENETPYNWDMDIGYISP